MAINGEQVGTCAEYINLRKGYIESFTPVLNAFVDFHSISFAWSIKEGSEYVRVADTIGEPAFFDVTGLTRAEMAGEMFKHFGGTGSDRLITDKEEKRRIVPLFK